MKVDSPMQDLSEADFLAFLYSERDRENSFNHFQGWNNWALIGAFVTVLVALYNIYKETSDICEICMFYYVNGIIAIFLSLKSFLDIFKRERGYDYTKVNLLKNVVPWIDLCLILISSATLVACSYTLMGGVTYIAILWIIVFLLHCIPLCVDVILSNKIVPIYYKNIYFPKQYQNILFSVIVAAIWGHIFESSFSRVGTGIWSTEFELSICFVSLFLLLYVFLMYPSQLVGQF